MSLTAAASGESSRAARETTAAREPTGYGPRQATNTHVYGRGPPPRFDGDEARYHIWEARFLAYLKTIGLKETILGRDPVDTEAEEIGRRNELAYAELCGCLDDKTLMLILYEAPDDGMKSLEILRRHFESEEKPRIVSLYTELTNVLMADGEDLADYLTRVEKIVAALNRAKETLSDALLVAMVLKGLTDDYNPFSVHVTQTRETLTFTEFKTRLRSFECTLKYRNKTRSDEVMTTKYKVSRPKHKVKEESYFNGECFICEKVGHRARDCRNKDKKIHGKYTKENKSAWGRNKVAAILEAPGDGTPVREDAKQAEEEQNSFVLKVDGYASQSTPRKGLLVDSGASAHIVTDEKAFIRFDKTFHPKNHVMELADGTRKTGSVLKKGDAQIELVNDKGKVVNVTLSCALLIPEYPQNILSVEAAASKGAKFHFENSNSKMILPDGTTCSMKALYENKPLEKTKKDPKRLSVERIYQKKTQLEHILLRPDSYIGSVEPVTQQMWVYDVDVGLNCRDVTFVPGLYKIFDEILVNAADNKQRDKSMSCIKVNIDVENNTISVWNNGKGIPVVEHKVEKVYVPALIFGQLLTSSNYDDEQKKVTGGRNGYGAKLCNIFSTKFTVETACKESRKTFKQTWYDNMGRAGDTNIKAFDGEEFTCITFKPDLSKFKMSTLDKDTVALMTRRAYDVAGSSKGVKVFFNGKRLPITGFRSYVDMYVKDKVDELGGPLTVIHEAVNERWEVCLTMSEKGFQQVSFVNSIATTKGGRHIDYVADQIVGRLIEVVKKKNKAGVAVKPFQVKNHMWLFVNCLVENPTFDSQTKENMTLQQKSFGSTCSLSDKFFKQATSCGIVESIMNWVKFKAQTQLNKKCSAVKHTKIKGVPKLDDANDAGGKNSIGCTLILTEGDSAKTLAVSGLGVVGRDRYGVFPLRGKMLNVREASHKQIMENAEINNVIKILGLQYKKNYSDPESLKSLRYGKIMIMTDQDQDGSHIKGLLINFIHHNWPSLLRHNFLEEFITPIIKASNKKNQLSFYSIPEFNAWKETQSNHKSWKIKYYKGLGTSTSQEAKEYFSDMERHRIPFKYSGPEDDEAISLAFSKKKVEERKEWLTNFMVNRRQRREHNLPEDYLYGQSTKSLSYNDFINKELVLFSNSDNERSIPCLVDGFKPGQRKVLFCCFKRNDKREVKVAQLAGSVAEMSAYHHGEVSLMMTIVGLAQNFVGSNNLNLLQPLGQFGTRLHGGKDSASPRYIFTMLSPLARLVFPPVDDNLLKYNYDDNQRVEPEWYIPIIPTVLVNGAEGIGTGWASKIPNYDIREIVSNIHRMLDGEEPLPMLPNYKGFRGTIDQVMSNQYMNSGEVAIIDSTTIEISELPVKTWTQAYKENVLEPMLNGTDKVPALITDYKEYHTDATVRFVVKMTEEKLMEAEAAGLHKVFKLQSPLTCNSMVLFDYAGSLKKYESVQDILKDFFDLRMKYYVLRKEWLVGMLGAESSKLSNQARFILEKIQGTLVIENKPKKELIRMLQEMGYDSDPVRAWKEAQKKDEDDMEAEEEQEEGAEREDQSSGADYNYLLSMPMWFLTKEKKEDLCKQRDAKMTELNTLKGKSPADLWKEDLAAFSEELERLEQKEKDDASAPAKRPAKGKKPMKVKQETLPTPQGRRVIPRVTSTMKAEAHKKAELKKGEGRRGKKVKSEDVVVKMEFGEEYENLEQIEETGLAARLGKKTKTQTKRALSSKGKQTTLQFSTVSKKPKKNPWSDEESEAGSDEESPVAPREHVNRPTKAPVKYVLSDSEDEFDDLGKTRAPKRKAILSDDDASFAPEPSVFSDSDVASPAPAVKAPEPAKKVPKMKTVKPTKVSSSSLSGDSEPLSKAPAKVKEAAAKKAAPSKKPAASKKKAADAKQPSILDVLSKPKAAAKKVPSFDSSDSESEGKAAKAAKTKPVVKRKQSSSHDSDSSSDNLMSRLKNKASVGTKKTRKWDEDDSFQVSDEEAAAPVAVAPREKPSRARKPVAYKLDSDSDEDV